MESWEAQQRDAWEHRARALGDTPRGVLVQGFSEALNQHLHQWHAMLIRQRLLPFLPHGATLLDLGAGYGRLSRVVQDARPDVHLLGLDFSLTYCRLYHAQRLGAIVCGDVSHVPFMPAAVEAIVAVTALMYVAPAQRRQVMAEVLAVLRPGGLALFVDPGMEYLRLIRLLSRRGSPTGGHAFTHQEYRELGSTTATQIVAWGGNPGFSVLLPLLYAAQRRPSIAQRVLRVAHGLDTCCPGHRRWTFYRWMLVRKHSPLPPVQG